MLAPPLAAQPLPPVVLVAPFTFRSTPRAPPPSSLALSSRPRSVPLQPLSTPPCNTLPSTPTLPNPKGHPWANVASTAVRAAYRRCTATILTPTDATWLTLRLDAWFPATTGPQGPTHPHTYPSAHQRPRPPAQAVPSRPWHHDPAPRLMPTRLAAEEHQYSHSSPRSRLLQRSNYVHPRTHHFPLRCRATRTHMQPSHQVARHPTGRQCHRRGDVPALPAPSPPRTSKITPPQTARHRWNRHVLQAKRRTIHPHTLHRQLLYPRHHADGHHRHHLHHWRAPPPHTHTHIPPPTPPMLYGSTSCTPASVDTSNRAHTPSHSSTQTLTPSDATHPR